MAVTERHMGTGNFTVSFNQEFTPTTRRQPSSTFNKEMGNFRKRMEKNTI